MKSQKKNSGDKETPYQCNFVLVPRKEKMEEPTETSEAELNNSCFSLEKRNVPNFV